MLNYATFAGLFIIVVICILIIISPNALFLPMRDHIMTPNYDEERYIPSSNGNVLHCWKFKGKEDKPMVLYYHGNAGNISYQYRVIELFRSYGIGLFLVDYSGYGKSTGSINPRQLLEDADTAYNYLRKYVPSNNIVVWGESMGGAAASYIASYRPCKALVLLSTFSNVGDVMKLRESSGWLSTCIGDISNYLFVVLSVEGYLREVRTKVIIIHSRKDQLIPLLCSIKNYQAIPHTNKLYLAIEGGHNTPILTGKIMESIERFW